MFSMIKIWAEYIGGAILAIGAALFFGERKGATKQKQNDISEANKVAANAATERNTIEQKIGSEPRNSVDATPQNVGSAPADSAVGRLRDNGWTRD